MESIPAPLAGKVAIVTGGSRGIGATIATTLARQGCSHIAITYSTQASKAQEVLDEIHAISPKIKTAAFAADILDADFGRKIVEQAFKQLAVDRVDICVSNAALIDTEQFPPTADVTRDQWNAIQNGLCWPSVDLARSSVKVMPKGGRIIIISSVASRQAFGDPITAYAVGKAAVEAAARNLAAMYSQTFGVTVNTISVGATATEALQNSIDRLGPEFSKAVSELSMLKRVGTTQEVADIVAFVASPQASWLTGNCIPANGGSIPMLQG